MVASFVAILLSLFAGSALAYRPLLPARQQAFPTRPLSRHPLMQSGVGFGAPPPKPPPSVASKSKAADDAKQFTIWAMAAGVQLLERLAIGKISGERGVVAEANVPRGARVLTVPCKLSLQVTTAEAAPTWCDQEAWQAAKWDARLAMKLLHEADSGESALQPWFDQLPTSFGTPISWGAEEAASAFEALRYPALGRAVAAQRDEWEAARVRAPGRPSPERWSWAMNVVRSRAFSGPYTGGTFKGALVQLFAAATLALGFALATGNEDLPFNGLCAAFIYVALNELFFGPRFSIFKRYVLCPWVDMLNHDGAQGGSDVAYEYFADAFTVSLDWEAGDVPAGSEVRISYGDRSNDVLLQYYGFVERANPHDAYSCTQEELVLAIDAVQGLPAGAVGALAAAGLTNAAAPLALRADGADELSVRLARILLHPDQVGVTDKGREPLADAAAEAASIRRLADVADAWRGAMPSGAEVLDRGLGGAAAAPNLAAFADEKRRVLAASAAALRARADDPASYYAERRATSAGEAGEAGDGGVPTKGAGDGAGGLLGGMLSWFGDGTRKDC